MIEDSVIHTSLLNEDPEYENNIRPRSIDEFIGQERLVENLKIFIQAARERNEPLEHMLFYGPPGLGKTTLSTIISREMQSQLHITSGPAIERAGDLAALLTNLQAFDVLFIDEIHRLKSHVEEILYGAMEDGVIDIMIGKGPTAKSMRIDVAPFTLVGATTRLSALSAPLRDRFGAIMKLDFYESNHMMRIVERSSQILGVTINSEASRILGNCSRGTPRIANRLLRRMRDFAQVEKLSIIHEHFVINTLSKLHVDQYGLDNTDKQLLSTLEYKFAGGPVGVSTLAAALSEEKMTIEEVYEPFLLQLGFIERTARGRKITQRGKEYIYQINKKNS